MRVITRLLRRLLYMVVDDSTSHIEIFMGLALASWGAVLLFGQRNIFEVYPSYEILGNLETQVVWGAAFLAVGIVKLWAAIADHLILRAFSCLLATSMWVFVDMSFWLTDSAPTGKAIYFLFAASTFFVFLRTAQAIREERVTRRANEHH